MQSNQIELSKEKKQSLLINKQAWQDAHRKYDNGINHDKAILRMGG